LPGPRAYFDALKSGPLACRRHNLGTIEAPDAKAAEAFAVKTFGLGEQDRKRLSVWESEARA
jgi:hypothetical protein